MTDQTDDQARAILAEAIKPGAAPVVVTEDEDDPENLLAMIEDAEIIDTIEDAMGDWIRVGWLGRAVLIGVSGSPAILDTPARRDRFAKAYAEAERRAEAAEAQQRHSVSFSAEGLACMCGHLAAGETGWAAHIAQAGNKPGGPETPGHARVQRTESVTPDTAGPPPGTPGAQVYPGKPVEG